MGILDRVANRLADRLVSERPAAAAAARACPKCGAGPERRADASPFGDTRRFICGGCAYEFPEES